MTFPTIPTETRHTFGHRGMWGGQTVIGGSEVIPIFAVEYDLVGTAIRYGKTMTSPFMPSWS